MEIERRYPLLFFHFYGVKRSGRYYFNSHRLYRAPFPKLVRQRIYKPYIAVLAEAELTVAPYLKDLPIRWRSAGLFVNSWFSNT